MPKWHVYSVLENITVAEVQRNNSNVTNTVNYAIPTTVDADLFKKAKFSQVFFRLYAGIDGSPKSIRIPLEYTEFIEFQTFTSGDRRYIQQYSVTLSRSDNNILVTIWRQCFKSDWDIGTRVLTQYCNLPAFNFSVDQIELFF